MCRVYFISVLGFDYFELLMKVGRELVRVYGSRDLKGRPIWFGVHVRQDRDPLGPVRS